MRRLFFLLLAFIGVAGLSPAAPAHPVAAPAHDATRGGCHDEGQAASHVCVGCAVAPDAAPLPQAAEAMPARPHTAAPPALVDRRTASDPPPPRAAA